MGKKPYVLQPYQYGNRSTGENLDRRGRKLSRETGHPPGGGRPHRRFDRFGPMAMDPRISPKFSGRIPTSNPPWALRCLTTRSSFPNRPTLWCLPMWTGTSQFDHPKSTKKTVLLTGFNGRQHDHSLHSVTSGPDGKWYFNSGNCGAIFTDNSGKTFRMNTNYRGGASDEYFYTPTHELKGAKSDDGYVWSCRVQCSDEPRWDRCGNHRTWLPQQLRTGGQLDG